MFLFNKNSSDKTVVKKDTLILDYLKKIEKDIDAFQALYLFTHKLQNQSMRSMQRQSLIETFEMLPKRAAANFLACPMTTWWLFSIKERMKKFWPVW